MSLWKRLEKTFERIGAARAASQLAAMGYHDAAKRLMLRQDED